MHYLGEFRGFRDCTMTVTVIALLSINEDEPAALGEYLRITGPLLDRAGAKILKRFELSEIVVGPRPAQTAVIVEYPDRAAVDMVFKSGEYQRAIPARDRAFSRYNITIGVGDDGPVTVAEQIG